jgi:hypothetical protein
MFVVLRLPTLSRAKGLDIVASNDQTMSNSEDVPQDKRFSDISLELFDGLALTLLAALTNSIMAAIPVLKRMFSISSVTCRCTEGQTIFHEASRLQTAQPLARKKDAST